jgi:hypothetical protein
MEAFADFGPQEHTNNVSADEEQKCTSKKLVDEVEGSDDEGTIESQNLTHVPVFEEKPIAMVYGQKNVCVKTMVSQNRFSNLEPTAKVTEVKDSESSEYDESEEKTKAMTK